MRKFVQLISNNGILYAVADDGTAWVWSAALQEWRPIMDLPQPAPVKVRERDV